MDKSRKRPSGYITFLMELLLSLLIFAVIGAICLMAFTRAESLEREAADMNTAVQNAQTAAEVVRSSASAEAASDNLEESFPDAEVSADAGKVSIISDDAAMIIELTEEGSMLHADISCYADGTESAIYEIETDKYTGEEAGDGE